MYFPFALYGANRPSANQGVRAVQAYFAKFPVELFDAIPGIDDARIDAPLDPVDIEVPEEFRGELRRYVRRVGRWL